MTFTLADLPQLWNAWETAAHATKLLNNGEGATAYEISRFLGMRLREASRAIQRAQQFGVAEVVRTASVPRSGERYSRRPRNFYVATAKLFQPGALDIQRKLGRKV